MVGVVNIIRMLNFLWCFCML